MIEAEKTERAIRNALGDLDRIDDDLGGALEFALYGQERAPAPQWDEILGYLAKARARSGRVRKGLSRESGVVVVHKRAPSFELKVNSDTREAVGEKIREARKLVLQTAGLVSEVMDLCSGSDDEPARDPIFQATALAMTALMGLHDVVLREGIEESAVIQ